MRQTISSPFFNSKSKLSPTMMRSLLVRGGGIQVDDALRRFGWTSPEPVATTVMTCDPDSGSIRGVRYETRGATPEIKFKAEELWTTAEKGVQVTLKFNDLSTLNWLSQGPTRNQTTWLDMEDLDVTFTKSDGSPIISSEEKEEAHLGKMAIRFTILPVQTIRVVMYWGIIPISKEELIEKVEEVGLELTSPFIPTVAMKLGFSRGKPQNGLPIALLPAEQKEDKVGLGHLPLVEVIGTTSPKLPSHDDLEEQLAMFLRGTNPTNNVAPSRIQALLEADSFPTTATGNISYEWPEYKGPVSTQRSTPAPG